MKMKIMTLPEKLRAGFTALEILFVLGCIAAVAAVFIPYGRHQIHKTRKMMAVTDIQGSFYLALERYRADHGHYPEKIEKLVSVEGEESPKSHGPYLRRGIPSDPWGRPYLYRYPSTRFGYAYDLLSLGPDGVEGSSDDISNETSRKTVRKPVAPPAP